MSAGVWTGTAFGLTLDSRFPMMGLLPGRPTAGDRRLVLELTDLLREPAWQRRAVKTLSRKTAQDGSPAMSIEVHAERGYLFEAAGLGRFLLSPDGTRLECQRSPGAGVVWDRYLACQVLPFASLVQGLEIFHASAVAIDRSAIELVGKSADDVRFCGNGDLCVPLERPDDPVRVGTLVFLESGDTDRVLIQRVTLPRPESLLAATFNFVLESATRLANQLEVCAALARECTVFHAVVPRRPGAAAATNLRDAVVSTQGEDFRMSLAVQPGQRC
jgi:hypothetical protein